MGLLLSSNFEYPSGVLDPTVLQAEGWTSASTFGTGALSLDGPNEFPRGPHTLRASADSGDAATLTASFSDVRRYGIACYVKVNALTGSAGQKTNIIAVDGGFLPPSMYLWLEYPDKARFDYYMDDVIMTASVTIAGVLAPGVWHRIEEHVYQPAGGSGAYRLWIDDRLLADITPASLGSANYLRTFGLGIWSSTMTAIDVSFANVVVRSDWTWTGPRWYPRGHRELLGWNKRSYLRNGMPVIGSAN